MSRIYTRSGDKGTTGIHGGIRVPKTDIRIETNGCIDELNVAIGAIRVELPDSDPFQSLLHEIQMNLMAAMSLVATPRESREENPNRLSENLIDMIEKKIDEISALIPPSDSFILPGGNREAVLFHQARVLARRAERRLWQLNEKDSLPAGILIFFNRLSDLFFIMARHALFTTGHGEEIWRKFGYKKLKK